MNGFSMAVRGSQVEGKDFLFTVPHELYSHTNRPI